MAEQASRGGPLRAVYRTWLRHPRLSLAPRGALAAGIAWYVGLIAPAPLSEYPYYAPLGAVIATTSSLVRSVRDSVQVTVAVIAGAGVARLADAFLAPGALSVALVVAISLLISGWRLFGEMGSWVAPAAIFVLILGNADALEFAGSFAGLVAVGAAIGVGVNLAIPPLPLTPAEDSLDNLSNVLADIAVDLADDVESPDRLSFDEWDHRRQSLHHTRDRTRRSVETSREAVRANPRVRWHRRWTQGQLNRWQELDTVAGSTDHLVSLLVDTADPVELEEPRRPALIDVLRALEDVLRADAWDDGREELIDRLDDSVQEFGRLARQEAPEDEELLAGAVAMALRRVVAALRS